MYLKSAQFYRYMITQSLYIKLIDFCYYVGVRIAFIVVIGF